MSDTFCPTHTGVKLLRLHINANQAMKYKIESATKFWFCKYCQYPYEIIPKETMVLLASQSKKKRGSPKTKSVGMENEK